MKLNLFILFALVPIFCFSESLYLRDNLKRTEKGDYLVAVRNKNYTVIFIEEKLNGSLVIQEITIPKQLFPQNIPTWRAWVEAGAPNHTAWVAYTVDLSTGYIQHYYSYPHQSWMNISESDSILSKLINLPFTPIAPHKRRYIGNSDGTRRLWHPRMIVEGQQVPGIRFDAWEGRWPQDQSQLSGNQVQIYLPEKGAGYPDYFPYWLQMKAAVGKAQLRIVDSGHQLRSPRHFPMKLSTNSLTTESKQSKNP